MWIIDGPSSSALFNSLQGYLTLTNNTYPYIMGLDLFELKSSDILDLILIKHVPTACLTIWCIQSWVMSLEDLLMQSLILPFVVLVSS